MPKNKNVLMNIHGVDFQIDDKSYKHFKSLPKIQQERLAARAERPGGF